MFHQIASYFLQVSEQLLTSIDISLRIKFKTFKFYQGPRFCSRISKILFQNSKKNNFDNDIEPVLALKFFQKSFIPS